MKFLIPVIFFLALILPKNVLAQQTVDLGKSYAFGGIKSLGEGIGYIVPTIIAIAGVMITFYFIVGAIKFIVSEGDKNSVSEAKKTITHTIIGAALLVLLFLAAKFVPEFFGLQGFELLR